MEKEARKAEREAETAGKEAEKDAENKRNINGKATQSNGNKKLIPIIEMTKRGKKARWTQAHGKLFLMHITHNEPPLLPPTTMGTCPTT